VKEDSTSIDPTDFDSDLDRREARRSKMMEKGNFSVSFPLRDTLLGARPDDANVDSRSEHRG